MSIAIKHRFVELIPKELEERVLYVSMEHAVAVHLCACGCSRKVVTPLAPVHWKLFFDGRTVSLTPSIGNHAFPCKSHYWIEQDRVRWSYAMSTTEVGAVRARSERLRQQFYGEKDDSLDEPRHENADAETSTPSRTNRKKHRRWWRRLFNL